MHCTVNITVEERPTGCHILSEPPPSMSPIPNTLLYTVVYTMLHIIMEKDVKVVCILSGTTTMIESTVYCTVFQTMYSLVYSRLYCILYRKIHYKLHSTVSSKVCSQL